MVEQTGPNQQFLDKMNLTKNNHQFLALLSTDFTFLMRLNEFIKTTTSSTDLDMTEIADRIREYAVSQSAQEYITLIETIY